MTFTRTFLIALLASSMAFAADNRDSDDASVKAEYANIALGTGPIKILKNTHPGAQWFSDAGLGLFIHWGIGSVKGLNLSHPMIAHLPRGLLSDEKRDQLLKTKAYKTPTAANGSCQASTLPWPRTSIHRNTTRNFG